MATINDKQELVAEALVQQILGAKPGVDALWNLTGAVGSGKTTLLRRVAAKFRQLDL